jgi:hypothetical protein
MVCNKCYSQLAEKVFRFDEQNRAVCSDCDMGGGKCVGCLKMLGAGAFVTAGKHKYHPDCFNCTRCVVSVQVSFVV